MSPRISSFQSIRLILLLAALLFSCESSPIPAFASEIGFGTYYTLESCKKEGNSTGITASGEIYRESRLTCALPHRNFGKLYRVRSLKTGKAITVKHNDLGPGRGSRNRGTIIDLTPAAFSALGHPLSDGKIKVSVEAVP